MRLATRLLLSYLLILGLVGGALGLALPRVSERALLVFAARFLAKQAESLVRPPLRSRQLLVPRQPGPGDPEVVGPNLLIIGPNDRILRASPEYEDLPRGGPLPAELARLVAWARSAGRGVSAELPGRGLVAGAASFSPRGELGTVLVLYQSVPGLRPLIGPVVRELLIWMLAGLALAVLLAWFISGALTRRLGQVGAAAAAVADGDFSQRLPAAGTDEVTALAVAFNHMTDRLQALVEGLRRSERLRRQLMASISHELRTPVTSIRGFAEALRDGVVREPADQRRYHAIIAGESARLGRLIQDLFDYATLEGGQFTLRVSPLSLGAWLREFATVLRPTLAEPGLRLTTAFPADDGPVVSADADRLAQVLHNLAGNAARYAPPGSTVTLGLVPAGAHVRIEVRDEGPGLGPQELQRVWEPLYRGPNGGAGLGLSIVRGIVTAHGGQCGVESAPGHGSCFWFTLPLDSE